jgi:hypothetical protein
MSLGDQAGVLAFIGGGSHPMARWTCLMEHPVCVHQWQEGDTGHPFAGLQERLNALNLVPHPQGGPFQGGWAGLLSY